MDESYLTPKEAAAYLQVSVTTLYRLQRKGLRYVKLTGTRTGATRYKKSWIDSWCQRKSSGGWGDEAEKS